MAGTNPAMVVKIAADISAMRAALKEGTSVIHTTTAAMGKLASSFDGSKIIQHAHNVTAAVNQIGGASKLTAAEQARVNTVVEKALEKYRALGKQAPADMQRLADATKKVEQSTTLASKGTDFFAGSFARLTSAFTAASLIDRAVGALVSWTTTAIQSASTIVNLADKTGLTTETIQRMSYVAGQTGTQMEVFTKGAFNLGIQLAGGSKSVVAAVNQLGLSYASLKAMQPDQQFDKVVAALERMTDPQERNRLGVVLFKKAFEDMAPAVSAGYSKLANDATVASHAQVKALDDASNAWARFVDRQQKSITSYLGSLVMMSTALKGVTKEEENFVFFLSSRGVAAADILADLAAKRAAATAAQTTATKQNIAVEISYVAQMAAARVEIAALTAAQRAEITAGQALGVSTDDLEKKYKLTEGTLKVFTTATQASERALKDAAAETKKAETANQAFRDSVDRAIVALYRYGSMTLPTVTSGYEAWIDKGIESNYTLKAGIPLFFETAAGLRAVGKELDTGTFNLNAWILSLQQLQPELVKSQSAFQHFTADFKAAFDEDAVAAVANLAQYFIHAARAIDQATNSVNKWKAATSGAMAGAQAGSAFGPYGTAIGALVGLFAGLIKSEDKLAASRQAAVDAIVKERAAFVELAGGITVLREKADLAGISLDKLFAFQADAAAFKAEIDRINAAFAAWQARIAGLNQAAGGLGSMTTGFAAPFLEAGAELDKLKQSLPELKAAVKDALKAPGVVMTAKEALALDTAIGNLQKVEQKIRDIKWNLIDMRDKGQAAFERLGIYALATFVGILQETGSLSQAFAAVGPALDTLNILQKKFGLTSSATVAELLKIRGVVTANAPLMAQIDGLTQVMTGLGAAGRVTQQLFTAFGQDAVSQFTQLQAKIKGPNGAHQALVLMQPTLQELWQQQQTFGFKTDEATQALIDEAVKIGLVGEAHKPVAEKMLTALGLIKEAIEKLIGVLTGPKGTTDALADLGAKTHDNQGEWTTWADHGVAQTIRIQRGLDAIEFPDLPGVPGPAGGGGVPSSATAPPSSSSSRTQGPSSATTVGDVHVHFANGPSSVAEADERGFVVADTVIKLLETNQGGRRTKTRRALRVA